MSKKRIYLLCEPKHANLGDQAQLMCTLKWLKKYFPDYKVIRFGYMFGVFDFDLKSRLKTMFILFKFIWLKVSIRKRDIFVGHSGYFFVDHHIGWATFSFMRRYFPYNKMIIMPQTINFYSPVARQLAAMSFGNQRNLTLLCRDAISFDKAKQLFGSTNLLLFPDIVTSLIGSMQFEGQRDGILFCIRDDVESLYNKEDIKDLAARFGNIRKNFTDTTIGVSIKEMSRYREKLILDKIKDFSTYKVVITDRYHGTIFSAIASTPVVVINSSDHKLSSGIAWFPKDVFGEYVQFAKDLEEAYNRALGLLMRTDLTYSNPSYFKEEYWDKLKEQL